MAVEITEKWVEWYGNGKNLVKILKNKLLSLPSEQKLEVLDSILDNKIPQIFSKILYKELWDENKDKVDNLLNQETSLCKWWEKSPKRIALEIFFRTFKFENYEEYLEKEDLDIEDIYKIINNEFNLRYNGCINKHYLIIIYLENKKILELLSDILISSINIDLAEKTIEIIELSKKMNWMKIRDFFIWEEMFPKIIDEYLDALINLLRANNWLDIIKLWKNKYFYQILSNYLYEVLNILKNKNWMEIIKLLWDRNDFMVLLLKGKIYTTYNQVIEEQKNNNIETEIDL